MGSNGMTTSHDDGEPAAKARVFKGAGWKFSRNGPVVTGENMRYTYTATICEVYAPVGTYTGGPKRLVDVALISGKWHALTQATAGGGRNRVMPLETFLARYTHGARKGTAKPGAKPGAKPSAGDLDRIERKLDALLAALGIVVEGGS